MRLAFVADGRSPHARGWLDLFTGGDHEVHLISTFDCEPPARLASFRFIPVAFSGRAPGGPTGQALGGASAIGLRAAIRHWLGPITLPRAAARLKTELREIQPDIVHAMRIPFEGILAAAAKPEVPLVISVWGNDFTLHAGSTPGMSLLTRRTLRLADGLHADCERDARLSVQWGYRQNGPQIVLPGGGGIDTGIFHPGEPDLDQLDQSLAAVLANIPPDVPVVVNPRGFRAYVRSDTFFKAIPTIVKMLPGTIFFCPAMDGERAAERWLDELGIRENVRLLPRLLAREMAAIYQRSWVMVSPSTHDGTPNSFLEAIACGCFPVVADLESLREWIEDGSNGLLTSASDPQQLAHSIVSALQNRELRHTARAANLALIEARASRAKAHELADAFYRHLIEHAADDSKEVDR
jgi:glycosyltransferase involved in cell wall biosynthesis